MAPLSVGDQFPTASLKDIDGEAVRFPEIFSRAQADTQPESAFRAR